jgi:hypothetical protein
VPGCETAARAGHRFAAALREKSKESRRQAEVGPEKMVRHLGRPGSASTPASDKLVATLEEELKAQDFKRRSQRPGQKNPGAERPAFQKNHVDGWRRRLGLRHWIRRSGPCLRHGRRRQRADCGHGSVLQHRRTVFQSNPHRRGGTIPGLRQRKPRKKTWVFS